MIDILKSASAHFSGMEYGELRFHERISSGIAVRKGELETLASST